MMPAHSIEEAQEQAALYALGTLRGEEMRAFETHLKTGCRVCAAEVAAFTAVAARLGQAARPVTPSTAVRARVLDRIRAMPAATLLDRDGVRIVRSAQLTWQAGNAPAVEIKTLHTDAERGFVTMLVRMEPGAVLVAHRHADLEESYVLEGDLQVAGIEMRAGDYCRAEPGSLHEGVRTRGGCVFIAVQSQRDEWFTT
jgi:anti-sigma factor ChrR (cupin superfamily)